MSRIEKSYSPVSYAAGPDLSVSPVTTVQLGESSVVQVARRLKLDPDDLLLANPQIKDPFKLSVGQDIHLPQAQSPAPPTHDAAPVAGNQPAPSGSNPAPNGDPLAGSVMKATLNRKTEALSDHEKHLLTIFGGSEVGLRRYQQMKREVAEAHRVYQATGKIPQTKIPFSGIEIKEGKLMTRAERYDSYLASQGHNPSNLAIGDLDPANRDEFLTSQDLKEEYRLRLDAAKKEFVEAPTKWKSTSEIEDSQAKITGKYFGEEGANHYRKDMAQAKQAGQEYQQHMASLENGGPVSLLGRGIDRLLGGDGETGAAFGGLLDTGFAAYAGYKGKPNVDNYNPSAGPNSGRPVAADIAPAAPKEPAPQPDTPPGTGGGGSRGGRPGGPGGTGRGPGGPGGAGGGGAAEYEGPTLRRLNPGEQAPAGVPALTRQQANMVGELRAGRDVIVRDLETARALLRNMPDIRPHNGTGNDPWETAPRGTYRGDLVHLENPAAPYVHAPGTAPDAHANNPHYNIVFPNGERAAIIISPR